MDLLTTYVALFLVATIIAVASGKLGIPYSTGLVAAGLILGAFHAIPAPHLTRQLLFTVFLPGLLFEAAFHLKFAEFWHDRMALLALAVPGVGVSLVVTAALLAPAVSRLGLSPGLTVQGALVFGALIAATDPIAVVALFRRLGAPSRLTLLVEGESLLNDGTSIVLFGLVLSFVMGQSTTVSGLILDFLRSVVLGALLGVAIGWLISRAIRRLDDPMIEICLTTIAAYGSFVVAERLEVSGVIASVSAGMICGNYAARAGMAPTTLVAVESFWQYVAFAMNSIVFLLIGFEVRLRGMLASWSLILLAYAVVTLGRVVVVGGVAGALSRGPKKIPMAWAMVLTWGGLRGGLSMVLALGLPASFPGRDLVITMTFGVVVLSILFNGITMPALLKRLKLGSG